jgi:hypothetical protein
LKRSSIFGLALAGLLVCGLASAHHSFAMFDNSRVLVLRGTMLSMSYMNPHAWISITVPAGSDVPEGRWDIEATSTGSLASQGVHNDTFKAGDKMTVGIHPLKDGRRGGSLAFIVDAAGKVYGAKPEEFGLKSADLKAQ